MPIQILACGNEDQTIFAMRVISTYVTFYKALIPVKYWSELYNGLPEETSVKLKDGHGGMVGKKAWI